MQLCLVIFLYIFVLYEFKKLKIAPFLTIFQKNGTLKSTLKYDFMEYKFYGPYNVRLTCFYKNLVGAHVANLVLF